MYDVVGAIFGYLYGDPTFRSNNFSQAIRYVLQNGVSEDELYQEFNDKFVFIEDINKWDYKYYTTAKIYLRENFCKKRISHVKAIAKKLYS